MTTDAPKARLRTGNPDPRDMRENPAAYFAMFKDDVQVSIPTAKVILVCDWMQKGAYEADMDSPQGVRLRHGYDIREVEA